MTTLLAVSLSGGYGREPIVHGIDLEVQRGSCTTILGPNGSGKSTLLRLLCGIIAPTSGSVDLLGKPLGTWRRRDVAQRIGYVPQWVDFSFPLTVEEVVEQGRAPHLGPWRPAAPHDRAAVRDAMERMELTDCARRPVRSLSGGERQRVLLARALATDPLFLVLDEPATALDVRHQLELVQTVRDLLDRGTGVVLVVHDWNLGLRLADQMLVLKEGTTFAAGPPSALVSESLFRSVFGVTVTITPGGKNPPTVVPVGLE